jgi:hypothetical protein
VTDRSPSRSGLSDAEVAEGHRAVERDAVGIASSSNTTRLEWLGPPCGVAVGWVPPRNIIVPGTSLQHVAEVLGPHHRVRQAVHLVGAEHVAGDVDGEVGERVAFDVTG